MVELKENRVYRPFVGGKLLDEFNGAQNPVDAHLPERWICSTTGTADGKGISETMAGEKLTDCYGKQLDILVKLIDSYTRLMIQVHPDDAYAQEHFGSQYGKMESWYVMGTRVIDGQEPFVFLGFKEDVTREQWEKVYREQDIEAMEACLHKIPVKPGDVFLIPGKVPHAMGSGVFFAEVQQPTDITLRTEWTSPDGRKMSENDIHGGTSEKVLFDCFDYDGADLERTLSRYRIERKGDTVLEHELFSMYEVTTEDSYTVEVNEYAIVVVLAGENKGREYFLTQTETFCAGQKLLICYGANK